MSFIINPFVFGGFQPDDIAGLALWLDAQDSSTITVSTGVSQWDDKSANGSNVTQGVAGAQPGQLLVSGRNTIDFDGTNDYLSIVDTATLDFAGDFSVYIVYKTNDVNRGTLVGKGLAVRYLVRINNADTNNGEFVWNVDDNTTAQTISAGAVSGTNYNDDTIRLFAGTRDGTNIRQYQDGTEVTESPVAIGAYGTLANSQALFIGVFDGAATQFYDGQIGEILIYDSALSSGDRGDVTAYLKNKWGIA